MMGLDILVFVEFFRNVLGYLLGIQVMYGFLILLTGNLMSDFYAQAIYEKPANLYQKCVNFFMAITIGSGYFINIKLMKFSWLVRKLFLLIALIIQSIISIIIVLFMNFLLNVIFY